MSFMHNVKATVAEANQHDWEGLPFEVYEMRVLYSKVGGLGCYTGRIQHVPHQISASGYLRKWNYC